MFFLFRLLIKIIFWGIILIFLLGFVRTWQLQGSENQKLFIRGKIPQPALDGFYQGSVASLSTPWLGKKFDSAHAQGTNVFSVFGAEQEYVPFKTSITYGLHDPKLSVLAIDYNVTGNWFFVRPIVDEVVETAPGEYLGKLQLRIVPGYPFTLIFFKLKK